MHQIRLRLGLCPRLPLEKLTALPQTSYLDLMGPTSKGREEKGRAKKERKERGKGKGSGVGRGSTQPGPTFSLVYATPLLQHKAQLGLNPALNRTTLNMRQGRRNGTVSVHLSVPPAAACGVFAAVGPAARRYRSTAARPAVSRSTARSRKCGQCHVISGRRKLNADLLLLLLVVVVLF